MIQANFTAKLQKMRAARPGYVVDDLPVGVPIDERRFGIVAKSGESCDADAGQSPCIRRNWRRKWNADLADRIPNVVEFAAGVIEERIEAKTHFIDERRRQHTRVVDDDLMRVRGDDRPVEPKSAGIDGFIRPAVPSIPR